VLRATTSSVFENATCFAFIFVVSTGSTGIILINILSQAHYIRINFHCPDKHFISISLDYRNFHQLQFDYCKRLYFDSWKCQAGVNTTT